MSETETAQALSNEIRKAQSGKYLTFFLADESYGLEILKVREIIGAMTITPVPKTPEYVKGVINLRGRVIPVVDLRLKFHLDETEATDETCIIVVDVEGTQTGIYVDSVDEVLEIGDENIESTPDFGARVTTDFILGVAKMDEGVKILLDIDKVLTTREIQLLKEVTSESE